MLSYRKLAMRVLGRPLHTEGIDSPRPASQRAAALVLTAAMLTTLAAPAFAKTWYIENGNITVKAGKIEGTNKVSQGETTDEKDTDTVITNRDKDTASSHTVTINANGKNDKVEVTLKDVNIEANSGPALTSKGDVTLTLKGENHLTGGNGGRYGGSGITSNGSLTITGGENDSLTAQGGSSADGGSGSYGGDGIGSGIGSSSGLTISGGTVNAAGGSGSYGGELMLSAARNTPAANKPSVLWTESWDVMGAKAKYPHPDPIGDKYAGDSSMWLKSGSYFKIKQIQLGYTLPSSITKKIAISRLRVYVSLDNFFCISSYWGMDPEAVSATSAIGMDYGDYPTPKTLTFGANLSF